MLTLTIKALIILLSISNVPTLFGNRVTFAYLLLAIAVTSFSQYYQIPKLTFSLVGFYITISLLHPAALTFFPVLIFDLATHLPYKHTIFLPLIFIAINDGNRQAVVFHILLGFIALFLSHLLSQLLKLDAINKEIRDTNAAQKLILTTKNQKLLERQSDVLHMAKLQERNRIARDIHDTIGHSLSRALLQVGALSAINQNEATQSAIDALKETLTNSMNSIRRGVHDLKDDGIDLKSSLAQILKESEFKTSSNYDVDTELPNNVKNCFLIVLKESITNTRKHSNATKITVTIAEHPAIYQFLVADNGTHEPSESKHGIGLQNIHERINELDGYCRMNYQGGFRTFITIPKREDA